MITVEHLENVKQKILETRKPIETFVRVQHEDGKIEKIPVAIIINKKAKLKQIEKGKTPITIDEIKQLIKDKETFEQQQESVGRYIIEVNQFYKTAEKTRKVFEGKYVDIS
ncbi:MAG: hypothetical protein D6834_00520 [Aquificota bacterium]|nr:MAG: hypothetical protein D6834_00520 [Aquificota bacterium]